MSVVNAAMNSGASYATSYSDLVPHKSGGRLHGPNLLLPREESQKEETEHIKDVLKAERVSEIMSELRGALQSGDSISAASSRLVREAIKINREEE